MGSWMSYTPRRSGPYVRVYLIFLQEGFGHMIRVCLTRVCIYGIQLQKAGEYAGCRYYKYVIYVILRYKFDVPCMLMRH